MELSALLLDDDEDFASEKALFDSHAVTHCPSLLNLEPLDIEDFYEVTDQVLGDGTFAIVFRGVRRSDRLPVAIKKISKKCLYSDAERQAIVCEVASLRVVRSDHVVKLLDVFETFAYIFLVLELCDGPTLDQYLKQQPGKRLKESEAVGIFRDIITGVYDMHKQSIMHCDLKPANVLMVSQPLYLISESAQKRAADTATSFSVPDVDHTLAVPTLPADATRRLSALRYRAKLCDLGTADRADQPHSEKRGLVGTPGYIAPEIIARRAYSEPVDIWSAGVLLYQMLFGYLPFHGGEAIKLDFPVHVPVTENVKSLLQGMLREHPSQRLRVDQILRHPALS